MANLLHITSPYKFFNSLNESVKTAREYFVAKKKAEYLPQYKQKVIQDIESGALSLGLGTPEEEIQKIESGEVDREIQRMLTADKEVDTKILSDLGFTALMDRVKENTTFGPNILALPIAKMFLRYQSEDDLAKLFDLIDSLEDNRLKDFLRGRNIDMGRLLSEFAEKEEVNGLKTYESFSDYLRNLQTEFSANWLIQELRSDAAMGPNRDRPAFNQVEAYNRLPANDPIRLKLISYGNQLEKNKTNPAVAAAIKTIKKKIAGYGSLKELTDFVGNQLDAALNSSDDLKDFLKNVTIVGPLADVVYQDDSRVVLVVHHEIALARLFSMASWCILPIGWGGGRNMWNSYIGPSHNTIQFAVMDFSKSASNNMRCWAFTYNVQSGRITYAHAKDDASITPNFNLYQLDDIFTKKESITGYPMGGGSVKYDDSETFTMPDYALNDLKENLLNYYETTVKYDKAYKLRDKSGDSIKDFSKSNMYEPGGLMMEFIKHTLVSAEAKRDGKEAPSFIAQNKEKLDMILAYLAADIYSADYRNKVAENKPTLSDSFILPFIKITNPKLPTPYVANNAELATYLIAVLKSINKFDVQKIHTLLKTLNIYFKQSSKMLSVDRASKISKFYYYQVEETIEAIKVYLKALDIKDIPVGSTNKNVKDLGVDDRDMISKFIDSIIK